MLVGRKAVGRGLVGCELALRVMARLEVAGREVAWRVVVRRVVIWREVIWRDWAFGKLRVGVLGCRVLVAEVGRGHDDLVPGRDHGVVRVHHRSPLLAEAHSKLKTAAVCEGAWGSEAVGLCKADVKVLERNCLVGRGGGYRV